MSLSETRIVMFEKYGQFGKGYGNLYVVLEEIDTQIKSSRRKNIKKAHVFDGWLRHKLIQNVLRDNGYNIVRCKDNLDRIGFLDGLITWD